MSPLKIFEYMANNKLILASDLPVIREILQHMENAVLCSPTDTVDWIKKLGEVVDNPMKFIPVINNANIDFKNLYTWDNRVRKILEIYNSALC
jgi:glycosyltransferase involved in cell wall biosynthesis